ncbi:MAG: S41 family peptidase [Cyclobacteriaceae bacterium]|nr:S41 family peptidase [Cyclobacteriaceae bacterium]
MRNNLIARVIIGGFLALLLVAASVPTNRFFEIAKNIEIYASLYKTVNEVYVDEVNPSHLMNAAVKSMLSQLDPYTVYISEDKIEDFRTQSTGQYGGIGASTIRLEGRVFISNVAPDGPAATAGIEVGDEVIYASSVPVLNKSNEELNQLVRGQAKTIVVLGIRKNGQDTTTNVEVIRDKIIIKNVPYNGIIKDNVGYIKFTQFTKNGGKNIGKAVKDLKKQGATSLIIDLRSNPGGLLHEAVNICNLFLPKDKLIVETKGKRPENSTEFKTLNQPIDLNIPLAILINNSSASASEIVAGTLQDYDRAVVIGQKSFGKGLVQNVRPLTYNAQLKVTIAKYYTPSGRCIQALDYAHRNENGSVGKVADSLKTAYKTVNGRTVYDGGGIDPDVVLIEETFSPLVIKLIQKGYIYKYANVFKLKHSSIPTPAQFNISNEQFNDFLDWVSQYDLTYKTKIEEQIEGIKALSKSSKFTSPLFTTTLNEIKSEVQSPIKDQLKQESNIIKEILEAEIALRYYDDEGGIETTLADDEEIDKAIEVLTNAQQYKALLSGV